VEEIFVPEMLFSLAPSIAEQKTRATFLEGSFTYQAR
jgi:hypothetical protein